jgi:hypothetical protein
MQFTKIWATTIVFACGYGIAHDQVTAHLCIEYFTVGHPEVFATESATLLAFGWGIIATWWMGALLGIVIAIAARLGPGLRLTVQQLLVPGAALLCLMALASLAAGIAGYVAATWGDAAVPASIAGEVPARSHDRFVADWWAHLAAYGSGFIGAMGLSCWIVWQRIQTRSAAPALSTRGTAAR